MQRKDLPGNVTITRAIGKIRKTKRGLHAASVPYVRALAGIPLMISSGGAGSQALKKTTNERNNKQTKKMANRKSEQVS